MDWIVLLTNIKVIRVKTHAEVFERIEFNYYCCWPFGLSPKPQILDPLVSMVSRCLAVTDMLKSVDSGAANMSSNISVLVVQRERQPQRVQTIITTH